MKPQLDEVESVALEIWQKVYQGRSDKLEHARHTARVAVAAHWRWGDGQSAQIEKEAAVIPEGRAAVQIRWRQDGPQEWYHTDCGQWHAMDQFACCQEENVPEPTSLRESTP